MHAVREESACSMGGATSCHMGTFAPCDDVVLQADVDPDERSPRAMIHDLASTDLL